MHFHNWVENDELKYFGQHYFECSLCGERKMEIGDMLGWDKYDESWVTNRFNEFFGCSDTTIKTEKDVYNVFEYFKLNGDMFDFLGIFYIYFNEKVKWYNFFKKKQIKKCLEFIEKNKPVTINVNYAIAKNIEIKNNIGM